MLENGDNEAKIFRAGVVEFASIRASVAAGLSVIAFTNRGANGSWPACRHAGGLARPAPGGWAQPGKALRGGDDGR